MNIGEYYNILHIYFTLLVRCSGAVVVVIVWLVDLQLPVQSVPITTEVVSSNPTQASDRSVVSSTNKTDHDITEILLKVALNTIKPNQTYFPESQI